MNTLNTLKMIINRTVDTKTPNIEDINEDSYKFPANFPMKINKDILIIEKDDEITKLANEIKNLGINTEFSPFDAVDEIN